MIRDLALVVAGLEKKLEYLCKETHPLFCQSFFKKTSSTNLQSAKIFYEFLITEHNNNNVRINTTLTYIKIISLFNEFVHYKDLEKITKIDVTDFFVNHVKVEIILLVYILSAFFIILLISWNKFILLKNT